MVEVKHSGFAFFTDVFAYLKRIKHVDAEDTIYTVKKTLGSTGMRALTENVHFDRETCWITPTSR